MHQRELTLETGTAPGVFDITRSCERFLAEIDADEGLLTVFVAHATAGIVVMELGAGSDNDLLAALHELLPRDDRWRHDHGSSGHGADHVLPLLASPSVTIPVNAGRMTLGTWQSVAVLDPNRDNARRTVRLAYLPG